MQENAVLIPSPVATMKAIKNETEIEGFRNCHIRDGAALIRYFAWLEEQLNSGVELNESQAAAKLEEFRSSVWTEFYIAVAHLLVVSWTCSVDCHSRQSRLLDLMLVRKLK